jgi:L,D-peptidoglycan transpeptidase YkuD (ErfK/YbiS/YcfS/YnhG family)
MDLVVSTSAKGAVLDWGDGPRRCAIGPAGIAAKKAEGDGITPLGAFPLREIFYRADRTLKPKSILPVRAIRPNDGWCDAPDDPNYNRQVALPYPAGAEHLWRDDHLYDLVAVVGFNDDPVVPGKGSAIFLHLAKADYLPTAGCVALKEEDLRAALEQLRPGDKLIIRQTSS